MSYYIKLLILLVVLLIFLFDNPLKKAICYIGDKVFKPLLRNNCILEDCFERLVLDYVLCSVVVITIFNMSNWNIVPWLSIVNDYVIIEIVMIALLPIIIRLYGKVKFQKLYLKDYYWFLNDLANMLYGGLGYEEAVRGCYEITPNGSLAKDIIRRCLDDSKALGEKDEMVARRVILGLGEGVNSPKVKEINDIVIDEIDYLGDRAKFLIQVAPEFHRRHFRAIDREVKIQNQSYKYLTFSFLALPLALLIYVLVSIS